MSHIVLLPYLPLEHRITVNGWQIVPRHELVANDAVSPEVFDAAPKYLDLYRLPDGAGDIVPCGCFLLEPTKRVGDVATAASWRAIGLALTAAVLEMNPSLGAPDDGIGDYLATSDNLLIYGHPYDPEGNVAVQYGVLVKRLVMGLKAGSEHAKIDYPTELHVPSFGAQIDGAYAQALHAVLSAGDDQARRIDVAIDWLSVAWRNSPSVTTAMRIAALRSAFEALLDATEDVWLGAEAFATVLKDTSAAVVRTFNGRDGRPKSKELSDLRWWFVRFAHLRNAIMHGNSIPPAAYVHDGQHFLPTADEYFRKALRATIVAAGFPEMAAGPTAPLGARTREARREFEVRMTEFLLGHPECVDGVIVLPTPKDEPKPNQE